MEMQDVSTSLGALGRGLPMWLVLMTAWTAGLLVVAWLADRLLRRVAEPGLRMALYAVVLIRVVLPVDWETPLGVMAIDTPTPAVTSMPQAVAPTTAIAEVSRTTAPVVPQAASTVDLIGLSVGATYVLGVLVLLAIVIGRVRRLHGIVARSTVHTVQSGAEIRVHESAGPMVIGVLRPTIVVPRAMLDATPPDVLDAVLHHEHAHVRHRDGLSALAMAVLCAIVWPIVPVWIAVARVRLLMELRADAAVVQHCERPVVRGYRRLLLELAQHRSVEHVLAPALDPVAALGTRLRAMAATMTSGRRSPWLLQLVFVGPLALVLLVLAARRPNDVTPAATTSAATTSAATPWVRSVPAYPHCRQHEGFEVPDTDGTWRAERRFLEGILALEQGRLEDAETHFSETSWLAASEQHDQLAAEAAAVLVPVLHRIGPARREEALSWSKHAEAAYKRTGVPGPMAIAMHRTLARVMAERGESDRASFHRAQADRIAADCDVVSSVDLPDLGLVRWP